MRKFSIFFGAATFCALAGLASAQQLPAFNVGDSVDVHNSGAWVACTVTSPLVAGSYSVHCGMNDSKVKADSKSIRLHVATVGLGSGLGVQAVDLKSMQPVDAKNVATADQKDEPVMGNALGTSVGARFGTREPRTCETHHAELSPSDAKDIFICDAEHEFGGSLYLVSDVSLLVSTPRAFNPSEDASKSGIDPKAPVLDIRASYNNYQCSQLSYSALDNPLTRNCNETKMSNAAGGCYKNTAGEWHCAMYDFHPAATTSAANVAPPTLNE